MEILKRIAAALRTPEATVTVAVDGDGHGETKGRDEGGRAQDGHSSLMYFEVR